MTPIRAKSPTEKTFLGDIVRWYRGTLQSLSASSHTSEQVQITADRLMASVIQSLFVWFLKQSDVIAKNMNLREAIAPDLVLLETVLHPSGITIDSTLEEFRPELFALFDRYWFNLDEMTGDPDQVLTPIVLSQLLQALIAVQGVSGTQHRKRTGSFDTPPEIVDSMVAEALIAALHKTNLPDRDLQSLFSNEVQPLFSETDTRRLVRAIASFKMIDPACGSGAFPLGLLHQLTTVLSKIDPDNQYLFEITAIPKQNDRVTAHYYRKRYLLEQCIYGVDIQPIAIQVTRMRCFLSLLTDVLKWNLSDRSLIFSSHLTVTNALLPNSNLPDWTGQFDIAIANPPYVDSEEMVKTQPHLRKAYTSHYLSAKGNWDLFVIFIERGIQLLKTGGILAYIVPNKLVAATYTQTLRKMLSSYTILCLKDYSNVRLFQDAHVYPIVLVMQKEATQGDVKTVVMTDATQSAQRVIVPATVFYRDTHWDRYFVAEAVVQLINKLAQFPLLESYCSTIASAATVSEAYALKPLIQEHNPQKIGFRKLINTGTIDRYQSRWARQAIRYLGDRFMAPIILDSDLSAFNKNRYRQATSPKIIVGGMTQVLECFYDPGEYLAGKSTTIILEGSVHLKFLLALLNSKLVSFWYKTVYRSLTLAGGYLRVSCHEIKKVPIPVATIDQQEEMTQYADQILELKQIDPAIDTTLIEQKIDRLVFQLYALNAEEEAIVLQSKQE